MSEIISNIIDLTANAGGAVINNEDITVTENGVYTAGEGYTGLGEVTVNVPLAYPNFNTYGNLTRNKYSFSGFSSSNYIVGNNATLDPQQYSWEIGLAFTTASTLQNGVLIYNDDGQFCLSANVDKFWYSLVASDDTAIINGVDGPSILQPNTKYFVKMLFDATTHDYKILYSTDKQTWNTERTVNSNKYVKGSSVNNFIFGLFGSNHQYPFNGTIHMDECYIKINDVITWSAING